MTNSSDYPQEKYAVYQLTKKENGSGLEYILSGGPFSERKQAIHKAKELNQSELDVYLSYVVSEYKGESWSPERPNNFSWETNSRNEY